MTKKERREENERLGKKMMMLLAKQRDYYIRDIDQKRIITNRLMYDSIEDELFDIQIAAGKNMKYLLSKKTLRRKESGNG